MATSMTNSSLSLYFAVGIFIILLPLPLASSGNSLTGNINKRPVLLTATIRSVAAAVIGEIERT